MGQNNLLKKKKKTEQTKEKITWDMALGKTSEEKLQLTFERKFNSVKTKKKLAMSVEELKTDKASDKSVSNYQFSYIGQN